MELYDYTGGAVSGMLEDIDAAEILKAMEAGLKTVCNMITRSVMVVV